LGAPDRTGNVTKPGAKKPCDPCFEDFYGLNWLPPFSPLAGQYWMAKHIWRGDSWDVAEADGPWHRYTTIPLTDIAGPYARGRLDWWYLEFSQRHYYRARLLQMILYPSGLLLGAFLCWWGSRRRQHNVAAVAETAPEPAA
jgi:hypothetical protein